MSIQFHTGICSKCGNEIKGSAPGGRANAPLCKDCVQDIGLEIVIRGRADTGKTTVASLLREHLLDSGFTKVTFEDVPSPNPQDKSPFPERLARNMNRPIRIRVELVK